MTAIFSGLTWLAKHATGSGLTLEQIKDELLNGRELTEKGSWKRQVEYAERTAEEALRSV